MTIDERHGGADWSCRCRDHISADDARHGDAHRRPAGKHVNTNGNTFSIQAAIAGTSLTVKTGPGADTVNVGSTTTDLGTIAGALTITGGTGLNTLNINDQGATAPETYTLSSVSLVRAGGPTVTFTGMPRIALNGGGGGNVVNVTSSLASSIATVNAATPGINTVNVGNAGSIGGVLGGLVVNGGNAAPAALNVDDQNGATDITLATNTHCAPRTRDSPMARCAPRPSAAAEISLCRGRAFSRSSTS